MPFNLIVLGLVTFLWSFAANSTDQNNLPKTIDYQALVDEKLWITENYPPYHYIRKDQIDGIAVRLLREVFQRNNLVFEPGKKLLVFPWARAVKELSTNPNAIVVSMGYTEERKSLFRLSTPLFSEPIVLIAEKQRNFNIENMSDLSKFIIGAVRDDIGERLLKNSTTEPLSLTYVQTSDALVQMLVKGRVDMIAYSHHIIDYQVVKKSLNKNDFEVVKVLAEVPAAIAFNRNGGTELYDMINSTIEQMHDDGTVSKMVEEYQTF
jgi:polar amino acid transport system substrate-binding protein